MANEHSDNAPGQNKSHTVYINGRPRVVTQHRLSYADVVRLAYPEGPFDESILYTVSYANPHGHDGTLAEGQDVPAKEGMSFNVGRTNRS